MRKFSSLLLAMLFLCPALPGQGEGNAEVLFDVFTDGWQAVFEMTPYDVCPETLPDTVLHVSPFGISLGSGEELLQGVLLNACFADLNGDGLPELCATMLWGSGMLDFRIQVYDFRSGNDCELEERGRYDYRLVPDADNGRLTVERAKYSMVQTPDGRTWETLRLWEKETGTLRLTEEGLRFVRTGGIILF